MKRPTSKIAAVAATVLTAATLSVTVASAGSAGAATPTQTKGCSAWAQAGTSKYYIRECAGTLHYASGKYLNETAYIKNSSSSSYREVTGFVSASWGQAGDGDGFSVKVERGHTKTITHAFKMSARGTYTAMSSITVGGHTAKAHTTIAN
jgi:hypothetical protein